MNATRQDSQRQIAELFYAAMSTGDSVLLDRALSPHWIDRTLPAGRQPGREGIRQALKVLRTAMPDLRSRISARRISGTPRSPSLNTRL